MSVWELEAYDTELRQARCREYTTSERMAVAWEEIPRIQFSDSGHGIVFNALPHSGRRKPTMRRMDHADRELRRLKAERRGR
jgi:hypothetical protein